MTTPTATPAARTWRRLLFAATAGLLGLAVTTLVIVYAFTPIGERYREAAVDAAPVAGVTDVDLTDSRFVQASIAVPAGTTVTWRWTDGEDHDVWFDDGVGSPVQADGTWSRTFSEPGEYRYSCRLHLFMDGRVVVD